MLNALQTIHTVRPATTDMAARPGLTVFVHGPLREQIDALQALCSRLHAGMGGGRPRWCRARGDVAWRRLADADRAPGLADLVGTPARGWTLELATQPDWESDASGAWWQFADLPPVLGMERASHVRVLLPSHAPDAALATLGEWIVHNLRFWWGSAGWVFHHTQGARITAHRRMAALAKRHWAVQIQDMGALQWDALRGMPGVSWLTLVGDAFATAGGLTMDAIASGAAGHAKSGIFQRRGVHGLALAAGPAPSTGDINLGDDLGNVVRIAMLVEPLLLRSHTPLSGPFARPEVLTAWLQRFRDPQRWLDCDVAAD